MEFIHSEPQFSVLSSGIGNDSYQSISPVRNKSSNSCKVLGLGLGIKLAPNKCVLKKKEEEEKRRKKKDEEENEKRVQTVKKDIEEEGEEEKTTLMQIPGAIQRCCCLKVSPNKPCAKP